MATVLVQSECLTAYLYGMAKASQNPDDFLAQKAEELRLRAAELPQEFGNTALFREQAAMSTLQGSVELAREYLTYNENFFLAKVALNINMRSREFRFHLG